jgi:glycosyltransferase involved in cell wall biosynthesis
MRAYGGTPVRIGVIGKFPPIQGGVSVRTYWSAHGLAALGHEVHVVTNAKEAITPYKVHMRSADWERCSAVNEAGSVTAHWTDPADALQYHTPMASPFVSKLAGTTARLHAEQPLDVIYSYYLEPYGVAGFLAAQMTGAPHVVRMAGSDAGRLWRHPQLELLYDHILRSAELVIASGSVTDRAIQRGVSPERIVIGGGFALPEQLFTPRGPILDIAALRAAAAADAGLTDVLWGNIPADRPYFGVYGKLGVRKGSFALLDAIHRLATRGVNVGLVMLAQGEPAVQQHFRARSIELGLDKHILQLPFLPHWRVPEFLRGCLAVCYLEQDFPIEFHTPLVAREVLLCGTCLIGSAEVIHKLPSHHRLQHGHGCVLVPNVNDIDMLSGLLATIAQDPGLAAAIGARGRNFALELEATMPSFAMLERTLAAAAQRTIISSSTAAADGITSSSAPGTGTSATGEAAGRQFLLTNLAAAAVPKALWQRHFPDVTVPENPAMDAAFACSVLAGLERAVRHGHPALRPLVQAVRIELAVAAAENDSEAAFPAPASSDDPLSRLRRRPWVDGNLHMLVPVRNPRLRIIEFDCDVIDFLDVRCVADFPATVAPGPSYMVAFTQSSGDRRDPLVIDAMTARILRFSDGSRTAAEVVEELASSAESGEVPGLAWLENLFVAGLICLHQQRLRRGQESFNSAIWLHSAIPDRS